MQNSVSGSVRERERESVNVSERVGVKEEREKVTCSQ
jgi:hypothetical protein